MKKGKKAPKKSLKKPKKVARRPRRRAPPKRPAVKPPSGTIVVSTPPGRVEVLPGYGGPRTARDFPGPLPPRVWRPIERGHEPPKKRTAVANVQIDGRSYTVDQTWSGLRFLFKVDALNVSENGTFQNLFTTHVGRTINDVAHWTEIGVARFSWDPKYHLFTYDSEVPENERWNFFGQMSVGEVFEFAIRLDEGPKGHKGPYAYETFCSGHRVRTGHLPSLECQVDLSHESWSHTGTFDAGDHMIAVEGWVNHPPSKARWYAPDLPIGVYSTDPDVKHVSLDRPFAYKFDSAT